MIGLGIESTAHTFSCAVIEKKGKKGKILSDIRRIFRPEADREFIHVKHLDIILKIVQLFYLNVLKKQMFLLEI